MEPVSTTPPEPDTPRLPDGWMRHPSISGMFVHGLGFEVATDGDPKDRIAMPNDWPPLISPEQARRVAQVLTEASDLAQGKAGESKPCQRCDGCGKIANTDDGEPWTAWTSLPISSGIAVMSGMVRPIDCPACSGRGVTP